MIFQEGIGDINSLLWKTPPVATVLIYYVLISHKDQDFKGV